MPSISLRTGEVLTEKLDDEHPEYHRPGRPGRDHRPRAPGPGRPISLRGDPSLGRHHDNLLDPRLPDAVPPQRRGRRRHALRHDQPVHGRRGPAPGPAQGPHRHPQAQARRRRPAGLRLLRPAAGERRSRRRVRPRASSTRSRPSTGSSRRIPATWPSSVGRRGERRREHRQDRRPHRHRGRLRHRERPRPAARVLPGRRPADDPDPLDAHRLGRRLGRSEARPRRTDRVRRSRSSPR